jgi:hypothetical protein
VLRKLTFPGRGTFALCVPVCLGAPPARRRKLAVCTQPLHSNATDAVLEWMAYHILAGVQHFYVYDRYDQLRKPLAPFTRRKLATHIVWPPFDREYAEDLLHRKPSFDQLGAMDHCLWLARYNGDEWVLYIDTDEYVHHWYKPAEVRSALYSKLDENVRNRKQLMLFMVVRGGLAAKKHGFLIERYPTVPQVPGPGNPKVSGSANAGVPHRLIVLVTGVCKHGFG